MPDGCCDTGDGKNNKVFTHQFWALTFLKLELQWHHLKSPCVISSTNLPLCEVQTSIWPRTHQNSTVTGCRDTDGNIKRNKSHGCGRKEERRSSHLRFLLCMSLWEQGGEGIGVVVQDCLSLFVCLTGKLHPSYLNGNRGLNTSSTPTPDVYLQQTHIKFNVILWCKTNQPLHKVNNGLKGGREAAVSSGITLVMCG